MPYFAVMAAAMGLQQLKAWQDNKQKEAFAAKQKEIRVAMQNREFDRLRRLQAEAHQIALDMEREAHEQRRQDIEKEYDNVFDALIDQFQLDKWPLNIVPFIMKGESFGSRVRGHDVATVHCLLTPSNNLEFNRYVYHKLDMKIETAMNLYWNSNSDHTVTYYGSSWKQKTPTGIPRFEYKDVERLYADLRNVPFICITPYFRESSGEFYFKVWIWGMGANTSANKKDLFPPAGLFKENISSICDFTAISSDILSEISSYLISMVGYLTDMYYWKMYQLNPSLFGLSPEIAPSHNVRSSLLEEYKYALNNALHEKLVGENHTRDTMSFFSKVRPYLNDSEASEFVDSAFHKISYEKGINNVDDCAFAFNNDDIDMLETIATNSDKYSFLNDVVDDLRHMISCNSIVTDDDMPIKEILQVGLSMLEEEQSFQKIQFNIGDESSFIAILDANEKIINDFVTPKCVHIEYKKLILSDRIRIQSRSFILDEGQLTEIINKI